MSVSYTHLDVYKGQECLAALTDAARTGIGNLLALSIDAARSKATVGEISYALEKVFGRHEAIPKMPRGIYAVSYTHLDVYKRQQ